MQKGAVYASKCRCLQSSPDDTCGKGNNFIGKILMQAKESSWDILFLFVEFGILFGDCQTD